MNIKPYLIVPKLIPQPTWGGNYIAQYKSLADAKITGQKIGQSYELSSDTMLSTVTDSRDLPVEIGDPKTGETIAVIGDRSSMFPLQQLIDENPDAVVGKKYLDQFGPKMQILIKFTQAKGNSFQVHFQTGKEIGHWKPKPESWYFMEKGRATLGLKSGVDLEQYKKTCREIEVEMQRQAESVKRKEKPVSQARQEIEAFLMTHSPFLFVNVVDVPKGAVIDLSSGGIHHSWEEGDDIADGNIVYEVQLNVMDNDCTLRSFDKGKIGDDGSIRPIHIDDYFKALDTDPAHNDPAKLIQTGTESQLFDSPFYKTSFGVPEQRESFLHLFVEDGEQKVGDCSVRKGASVFVPASVRSQIEKADTTISTYL